MTRFFASSHPQHTALHCSCLHLLLPVAVCRCQRCERAAVFLRCRICMGFVLIRPTAPAKAMVDLMLRLRADPQFRANTTSTQRTFNR